MSRPRTPAAIRFWDKVDVGWEADDKVNVWEDD